MKDPSGKKSGAAQPAPGTPAPPPASGEPVNILLVDDDPRNLDVLEATLASPDYRLVRAASPDQALLALVQREFAAIVLDIQMPELSGLELAHLIKQRKRTQHIPIIFLTAYLQDDKDVLQGYGAGAVDYLTKPINPQILKSKVRVVVDLFRTTRALAAVNSALQAEVGERKKAQEELRQANAALEARVQERTADLSRANRELRRSEERYRLILENALEYAIFTLDCEGHVTTWNAGAQRILGFEEQEIVGRRLDVIFTEDDRQHGQLDLELGRAVTHNRAQDERWHLRKDGSPFWAAGLMMPLRDEDDEHVGFLKILRDRTSRKLAEEALRASEERFRSLITALPAAVYTTDAAGVITLFNAAAEEMWGRQPEMGVDKWCGSVRLYRPDGTPLPLDECPMAVALREGRALRGEEIIVERSDGRRLFVLSNPEPLRDSSGQIVGGVNMLVDITGRKRAEEARARLAALVESSADAIISKSLRGTILNWNAAAERLFGYRAEEIVGQPITLLYPPDQWHEEEDILRRIRTGETLAHFETTRRRQDGSVVEVSLTISPIRDETGRISAASTIARDITEQKRAEQLLRESRETVRRALEFDEAVMTSMGEGLYTVDNHGLVTSMNPAAERLFGWTREELLGRRMHEVTHYKHQDGSLFPAEECAGLQVLHHGHVLVEQTDVFIRKDGTFFDVVFSSSPLRSGNEIVGLVVVFRDVSEAKQAQEALRESEALKGAILNSGIDCIITVDQESRIVEFNPAAERTFGYTRAQALGQPMPELLIPSSLREAHYRGMQHYLRQGEGPMLGKRLELTALRADGSEFPAELSIFRVPLDGPPLFTAFLRDITDRKRTQTELAERIRLLDLSNDAILVRDANDRIIYWNHGAEEIYGWSREEALGKDAHTLLHSETNEPMERILSQLHRDNRWSGELLYRRRDGRRITVAARWALDRDLQGRPAAVLETANDVTARIQAEERFVQLNNTLVSVMESIPDALFVTDANGQIRFRNPAASRFSRGAGLDERLPPPIEGELQRVIQTGEHLVPKSLKTVHRFVLYREERFFLSRILCMLSADNRPFGAAVMLQDVTELRLLDEIKTNLISTVSHELKTPLTSLRTALLVLLEQSIGPLNDSQLEMMGIAQDDSERLLRTLNELLDLTRFEEGAAGMQLEDVATEELLQAAMKEVETAAVSAGVTISAELEPPLPTVLIDRERVLHVLTNLLTNAIKYSPPESSITIRAHARDGTLWVSVLDQGPGVPPQYQSRIFDKFFRVPGTPRKGAGLGLSIAREFVRAHHGQIGVRSEPGHGSEFYFTLPLD